MTQTINTPASPVATLSQAALADPQRIARTAARYVGWTHAEDVAQEVWCLILRRGETFNGDSDPWTWLHTTTTRAALAYRHKLSKLTSGAIPTDLEDTNPDCDTALILNEEIEELRFAVDCLPDTYRPILQDEMRGMCHRYIEETHGLTSANLKNRLHRGKQLIREIMLGDE